MRAMIILILMALMAVMLTACGTRPETTPASQQDASQQDASQPDAPQAVGESGGTTGAENQEQTEPGTTGTEGTGESQENLPTESGTGRTAEDRMEPGMRPRDKGMTKEEAGGPPPPEPPMDTMPAMMPTTAAGSTPKTTPHTDSEPALDAMSFPSGPADGAPGRSRDRRHQYVPDLKAGDVDDNGRWQEYLKFVREYDAEPVNETSLDGRQIVTVVDRDGNPVPNAEVKLIREGETITAQLTYADGRTMFFTPHQAGGMTMKDKASGGSYRITASRDGFRKELELELDADRDGAHEIMLGGRMDYGDRVDLDVLFLLDSTGSMADEIEQIKKTLDSIALRVGRLPSRPDLRFAMLSYRDRDDDYVTRLYDFESSVERFRSSIRDVRADGGDDYPESMNQALHEAVNDAGWRKSGIRLIFLVADAPPHLDYPQDEDYSVDMVRARQAGIKVFSVASSGLDQQGERVMRQIAQQTMGKFLFILYASSPQGGLDTPHSVEQYSVDQLDDLIVGLIKDELAALGQESGENDESPGMEMK